MRFVFYPLLGLALGAIIGAAGGFVGGAVIYGFLDPNCFEGSCGLAGFQTGAVFMIVLGIAGAALGLWRACLRQRSPAG